jgi:hypothetical protein
MRARKPPPLGASPGDPVLARRSVSRPPFFVGPPRSGKTARSLARIRACARASRTVRLSQRWEIPPLRSIDVAPPFFSRPPRVWKDRGMPFRYHRRRSCAWTGGREEKGVQNKLFY